MTPKQEIQAIVSEFFVGDAEKINAWWYTPNPLLGDVKPAEMIGWGKEEKLLKLVKQWRAEDKVMTPPKDLFSAEDFNFEVTIEKHLCSPEPRHNADRANAIHEERCPYKYEGLEKLLTENARLRVDAKRFEKQAMACGDENARLREALQLIAAPKRSDGTYNRSREACEQLARAALEGE